MSLTIEIKENEANEKMDLLDRVSRLGGRVVRKAGELKDSLSCARSWKFLICLGGLVTLIVLVCIVKNHVQDHANKFDERLEDIQERMNVSEKLANHLKEHTQGLSKRLDGMTIHLPVAVNCEEVYERGSMTNGDYTIDPDGKDHGVAPFNVHCDFEKETTTTVVNLAQNKSVPNIIEDNTGRSKFRKEFGYAGANIEQLAALADSSKECEQSIKFSCHMTKISGFATWIDRNNNEQTYFTGSRTGEAICECAATEPNTCAASGSEAKCNCDQMYPTWREDSGVLTDKSALPIKGFQYMHIDKWSGTENATISVGPLKCKGRSNNGQTQAPKTCKDYKKAGKPSGLYTVVKTEAEMKTDSRRNTHRHEGVKLHAGFNSLLSHAGLGLNTKRIWCDMTVAEDSSNFEVVVGDIDIKTNIDIKMELMHTVAKGVDIKFDHVEVKPGWLASSTVVDNSVIVAPWKGNFTVESKFFYGQLKVMVYTDKEWKEIPLAKDDRYWYATRGQIFLEENDRVKFILDPKLGGRLLSCSSWSLHTCAIGFSGGEL